MKKFLTVLLSVLVAFAALSSVTGCSSATLSGGYKYTLTPAAEVSAEDLKAAAKVIEERLIGICSKADVKEQKGQIIVTIPKSVDNPDEVVSSACKKGGVEFRDSAGNVRLKGEHIKNARAGYNENGEPSIFFEFTTEGTELFAKATKEIAAQNDGLENILYIYICEKLISSPTVNCEISNGNAVITDNNSYEEAKRNAAFIKSGDLTIDFQISRDNPA